MKYNNFLFAVMVALSIAWAGSTLAQDAPPKPRADVPADQKTESADEPLKEPGDTQEESGDNSSEKPEMKSADKAEEQKPNEKPDIQKAEESDEQEDEKSADKNKKKADDQSGDKKVEDQDKKSDDKKADDKKADDKKADDKKADDKKADDENADDENAGDEETDDTKSDDKKADEPKMDLKSRFSRRYRDQERVGKYSKKAAEFVSVFEPIVGSVDQSTISVVSGKSQIALGTIVDSNGLVLTKASEMKGSLGCQLNDGTILEAKVVGIDPETDLALLKIDAENLSVAQWSDLPAPVIGQWLVTPKGARDRDKNDLSTIGVVSVNSRFIPPSKPFIGIIMANIEEGGGVRISSVVLKSPAENADLLVNDVIEKIDDQEVKDIENFKLILENYEINDRVTLTIKRRSKTKEVRLTLGERDKISPENQRSNQQNSMGSILSRRRKNFPEAFQHDSMLSSSTCGGPIVDLSGKIVGINIARAGRVSSLALPTSVVLKTLEMLKTGERSPAIVNKEAIEKIDVELLEMSGKFRELPEKKTVLERKYNVERARMDELNKSMADLRARLKVIETKSQDYKSELDSVRKELKRVQKSRERLQADREQLQTGSR